VHSPRSKWSQKKYEPEPYTSQYLGLPDDTSDHRIHKRQGARVWQEDMSDSEKKIRRSMDKINQQLGAEEEKKLQTPTFKKGLISGNLFLESPIKTNQGSPQSKESPPSDNAPGKVAHKTIKATKKSNEF
jgi:hypothetical protein